MSDTLTIELSPRARQDIEEAARAAGLSPETFVAEAAARHARAIADSEAFFRNRAQGADLDAFDRLMSRKGGNPPQPNDEVD